MTDLDTQGFVVIDGPFRNNEISALADAYDDVFASRAATQIKRGSTSTRFGGFAALEPFHRIYLHAPLTRIATVRIGGPIRLSSFSGRTLLPGAPAPPLHQDVRPGADGDPLVGFIFMVDDFRPENGATRFSPGSRALHQAPCATTEQWACGAAGSLLIFEGATWHEHGANQTGEPRRSIQGYFIQRNHTPAVHWDVELNDEDTRGLPAEARRLLCL